MAAVFYLSNYRKCQTCSTQCRMDAIAVFQIIATALMPIESPVNARFLLCSDMAGGFGLLEGKLFLHQTAHNKHLKLSAIKFHNTGQKADIFMADISNKPLPRCQVWFRTDLRCQPATTKLLHLPDPHCDSNPWPILLFFHPLILIKLWWAVIPNLIGCCSFRQWKMRMRMAQIKTDDVQCRMSREKRTCLQ